jgi:hypothetical protein
MLRLFVEPMNESQPKINDTHREVLAEGKRLTTLLKPEWNARRNTAKTLTSLASAALIFTITFSQAIKTGIPTHWRYIVVASWLSFVCTLICSLGSLWTSMPLSSFPAIIKAKEDEVEERLKSGDLKGAIGITMQAFRRVKRSETVSLWLLRLALIFYGVALGTFTAIGLYQLLT